MTSPVDVRDENDWTGLAERDCGEHRTTGGRAWCFNCSEWCSPTLLCNGCEAFSLRGALERLTHVVISETELHTFGKPGYDITLDHLHDEAVAARKALGAAS